MHKGLAQTLHIMVCHSRSLVSSTTSIDGPSMLKVGQHDAWQC